MTRKPTGPACGNNPNVQLTPGDRKAIDDFKARLALQASAKPYIDNAVWVDGDPLMEVIAATVWKRCARDDQDMPQMVCDDPRTIAAFAAAVARAHAAAPSVPADADLRTRIAQAIRKARHRGLMLRDGAMADAVLAVLPVPADRPAELEQLRAELAEAEEADDLGLQLYRAQDALAFVEECCTIADREQRPVTTGDVREWLKGARCGRQLAAGAAADADLRDRIADGQGEPAELRDLPRQVRRLVHAVDRLRGDWAESSEEHRAELWRGLHEANEAVWNRPLAVLPTSSDRPTVLREAADEMDAYCEQHGVFGVGDRLRRMANEAQQNGDQP